MAWAWNLCVYFGLLTGATLGGNLIPIGASANIAAIGILRKNGETVTTRDFLRIGVPFTLAAVLAGYAYLWRGVGQSLIFWPPTRLPAEEKNKETPTLCTAGKSACRGLFSRSMTFCSEEKVFLEKCLTILPYLV